MRTGTLLISLDPKFRFHIVDFLTFTVIVENFLHFCLLVVQNNQISVAHVEAG